MARLASLVLLFLLIPIRRIAEHLANEWRRAGCNVCAGDLGFVLNVFKA